MTKDTDKPEPMISPDHGSKFKSVNNAWLLKPIFYEMSDSDKSRVLYTLKPEDYTVDGKTYPSLRRLYLEEADTSEYYFAEKYFGGYPHFRRLLSASWFLDYLSELREELALKIKADATRRIAEIAADKKDRGSLAANRAMLESVSPKKSSVGRPTKESIKREADQLFRDQSEIDSDLDRIKLSLETQSYGS